MYTEILTAIITAGAAILGSYFVNNKTVAILQTKLEDLKEDVSTLSKRVDKHNSVAERMIAAEKDISQIKENIKRG